MIELFRSNRSLQLLALNYGSGWLRAGLIGRVGHLLLTIGPRHAELSRWNLFSEAFVTIGFPKSEGLRWHQGSAIRMETLASWPTILMKQVGNWVGNGWGDKYKEQLEQRLAQGKWRRRSPPNYVNNHMLYLMNL